MAVHISKLNVLSFRGIRNLHIDSLGHINMLVGNNNCGKTSLLESILLLKNPKEFSNVLRIARQRNSRSFYGRESLYKAFISLFQSKNNNINDIALDAVYDEKLYIFILQGERKRILLTEKEIAEAFPFSDPSEESLPNECEGYDGNIMYSIDNLSFQEKIKFHEYEDYTKFPIDRKPLNKIIYLTPFSHLEGGFLSRIIANEDYKKICIKILKEFDKNIEDILLIKDEYTNNSIECIKHSELGIMSLSTYGDGIKKVISIASALAIASNGVLLIDEIETAIHAKYYSQIFGLITQASKNFNVQVFMTTHSLEAIDVLLDKQAYGQAVNKSDDPVKVITLKKGADRTFARVLSGKEVSDNREQFGFEVRL